MSEPAPSPFPALRPEELARQLRTHAYEVDNLEIRRHLRVMADSVDGGTGTAAHHGCPDPALPAADCCECDLVLEAEVTGGGRTPSIFDPTFDATL